MEYKLKITCVYFLMIFIMVIACLIAIPQICFGYQNGSLENLDLFEMSPLYAKIFEPSRYLLIADYKVSDADVKLTDLMFNPANFLLVEDPNDPNDPVVKYWIDLGADPNLFGENDPGLAQNLFERDSFVVDLNLPIFADPNMRAGGPAIMKVIQRGTLDWDSSIDGYGNSGIKTYFLVPLPIDPYDGMPKYLPTKSSTQQAIAVYGKPYFPPGLVFMLESALWNAGVFVWPNIATLDYVPMYFYDLILTIEVTNGTQSDYTKLTIHTVDHILENYLPVYQNHIDKVIFFVGESNFHHVNFIDPDCFMFSTLTPPSTSHLPGFPVSEDFRTDMDNLNWTMTIDSPITDQNSPLIETILIPGNGLISWVPQFETTYDVTVSCSDTQGDLVNAEFKIICLTRTDTDEDSIYDYLDNCPDVANADQIDTDSDKIGDACDSCPNDPNNEEGAQGCMPYYKDTDQDGYGVTGDSRCLCDPEGLYTAMQGGDPNDQNPSTIPVTVTINMELDSGWSLISLPVISESLVLSDVFPGAVVVYSYKKDVGYMRIKEEEALEPGLGYWILLDQERSYSLTGYALEYYAKSIDEDGWYMIGSCASSAKVMSNSCNVAVIYKYIPALGYQRITGSESLESENGYWILLKNVGDQAKVIIETSE